MRSPRRVVYSLALAVCFAACSTLRAQQTVAPSGLIEEAATIAEAEYTEYASVAPCGELCRSMQGAGECNCPVCQAAKKAADLKRAVASSYKPLFYDNNFSYINNPA